MWHSSLLGWLISYEEIEVLWIRYQVSTCQDVKWSLVNNRGYLSQIFLWQIVTITFHCKIMPLLIITYKWAKQAKVFDRLKPFQPSVMYSNAHWVDSQVNEDNKVLWIQMQVSKSQAVSSKQYRAPLPGKLLWQTASIASLWKKTMTFYTTVKKVKVL